ncbi:MAG: M20/M25/M40 family metallo-hydrolase [Betaproteobacteria bacterium]
MKHTSRLLAAALLAGPLIASAQVPASRTRPYVETLASTRFDGRLAGSEGERLAGDYLASELQKIGAKPLPGQSDFREPFDFTAGMKDGGSSVKVSWLEPKTERANGMATQSAGSTGVENGARALSFSDNGTVDGPIVFAGYGIVVPDSQDFGYDSYAGLDVKDKVVLVLRYFPEDADQKTRGILARYSDLRYKAMLARQHGAKALLVVAGPRSPNAGELVPMSFDTALSGSGIVAASITMPLADAIFKRTGHTLEEAQKALDTANPHVPGFAIPNTTAHIVTNVVREKQTGRNIVAYLPATGPLTDVEKPWIAIGAHYDHLGHGGHGSSLAHKDEAGRIHFGADDNASGTAAVLAMAGTLATQPRHRNVLVTLWSGEEEGLLGSTAFVKSPPVPLDQIEAYLNFDMVGRMQDNKLTIQAMGTSPEWARVIEQANVAAGFDLQLQQDPYQPTDVASFNLAGVPCLTFFTGTHVDYHRPTDTADKIDYADLDRIVDFATAVTRRVEDLPQPPQFTKVEQKMQPGGGRAGVRVTTGTIPDYSTEAKGLLLSGVIGGGPAEQAGLQKGDIIIEIAGQTIANIYDYTYALEVLKIGQPVKVVYMRGAERRETMLTPAARK